MGYTALTRGRHENHLYLADRQVLERDEYAPSCVRHPSTPLERLQLALERSDAEPLALDHGHPLRPLERSHPRRDRAVTDATDPISGITRADLMTAAEVANLLGVPVSTVRHWGRVGLLPRIKLGRHVRFIRAHVERALFDAAQHLPP